MKSVNEFEKDGPLVQSIARMRERGSIGGYSPMGRDNGRSIGHDAVSTSSLQYMSKGLSSDGGF